MGSNLRISSLVESNRGLILAPVPGRVELVPYLNDHHRPPETPQCGTKGDRSVRIAARLPRPVAAPPQSMDVTPWPPRRPTEARSWPPPQTAQVSALQTCRVRWRATSSYTRGPMVAANGR